MPVVSRPWQRMLVLALVSTALMACGDDDPETAQAAVSDPGGSGTNIPEAPNSGSSGASDSGSSGSSGSSGNSAPTISGNPPSTATQGQFYSFTPTAADPDGDTLTFSITGRPGWASFNTRTGRLSGTPGSQSVRTYSNIVIRVSDGTVSRTLPAFSIAVNPSSMGNAAPTISGTPRTSVLQGQPYSFRPTAADGDGDALTFSITGAPEWASFNETNGTLSGTPSAGDVGTYANIVITVSDGSAGASLAPFSIEVLPVAMGTATLSWVTPTTNTDGSPLTDLAGFRIYWGTEMGNYEHSVMVPNPGLTSYVIEQLTPATWYFTATAVNRVGVESDFSNVATKRVQ